MLQSQFSLTWDLFKSNLCNGFTALQQNEEFVDMTIAAEGHFVKVHQMIVALASPYLKELITSAPCQHPVLFLNNVSHRVLCLLLEYMYRGEAVVPADCLSSFAEAARALQIKGLDSIETNTLPKSIDQLDAVETSLCPVNGHIIRNFPKGESSEVKLAGIKTENFREYESTVSKDRTHDRTNQVTSIEQTTNSVDEFPESIDDSNIHDSDHGIKLKEDDSNTHINKRIDKLATKLQYTVSIRGSLQVILNRFIYNLYSTKQSGLRRWRCVNYKDIKCSASITTKGNVVLSRSHFHNHAYHDKKILSKIQKKAVFSAIEEVQACKE